MDCLTLDSACARGHFRTGSVVHPTPRREVKKEKGKERRPHRLGARGGGRGATSLHLVVAIDRACPPDIHTKMSLT